jgi:hypothetical protein
MLIVKMAAQEDGTRGNQRMNQPLSEIPEGWVLVPEALEEQAVGFLPWLTLELDGSGAVIGVGENAEAKAAWEAAEEDV